MEHKNFSEAVSVLPLHIRSLVSALPDEIKNGINEIRLRKEKPIVLWGMNGSLILRVDGTYSCISTDGAAVVTEKDLSDTVNAVCGYSVYSNQSNISNGFVTFGSGNRVGFSGEAVYSCDKISMLKSVQSVNIRIAMNKASCPTELFGILRDFRGIIVAGAPCSGKTTLLKGICEKISSDFSFGLKKTVVVDERGEFRDTDGINCDILTSYSKTDGIVHALRTLSPDVIICDEITTAAEAKEIIQGLYSGVSFIVSVHCADEKEIFKRPVTRILTDSGFFEKIIMLGKKNAEIKNILKTEEFSDDIIDFRKHNNPELQHSFLYNSYTEFTH